MQGGVSRFHSKRFSLIVGSVLLIGLVSFGLFIWKGCQGLPPNVAHCAVTPAAPSNTSVLPPAIEPPPPVLCGFPLAISVPGEGATVNSPANVVRPGLASRSNLLDAALR